MELALNLVWVCVALAGIALLGSNLSHASGRSAGTPSKRQKIIAMSCALIILFFVISMTDDLHGMEILVEDSRSLRVTAWSGAFPHSLPQVTATPVFAVLTVFAYFPKLPSQSGPIENLTVSSAMEFYPELSSGRAPPASLA